MFLKNWHVIIKPMMNTSIGNLIASLNDAVFSTTVRILVREVENVQLWKKVSTHAVTGMLHSVRNRESLPKRFNKTWATHPLLCPTTILIPRML